MSDQKLIWLDLETTGLDARVHNILEIAMAEADLQDPFNIKHSYHAVLMLQEPTRLWRNMDSYVEAMHTKNGLLAECMANGKRMTRVFEDLFDLIPIEENHRKPILAGSSVHFDHEFLRSHMPHLEARFSHRHYDVSAIKLFCQSLGMEKIPKAEAHRAVADIEESVAHAKMCAVWLKQEYAEQPDEFFRSEAFP